MVLLSAVIVIGLLSACDRGLVSSILPQAASPTETPTAPILVTPSPIQPAQTATVPEKINPEQLTIWVPPQFNPQSNSPAGVLLKSRLDEFVQQNPEIKITVRTKALNGAGGLLETLSSASAVAPAVVPSLIALPRTELETAALKSLVFSFDGYSVSLKDADWFPYAKALGEVDTVPMGLPFAGDALLLTYRPGKVGDQPNGWRGILGRGQPVIFPAADPQGLLTLALYRSAGGRLQDEQGRPTLDSKILSQVLGLYADGARQGCFPTWLAQYQTDGQAWQAFSEQRANWAVTMSYRYLSTLPADTTAIPLPPLGSSDFTLATGWVWALSDPIPERRPTAVRLAEFLTDDTFLNRWSSETHYLPVRPSTLSTWTNQTQRALVSQIVLSAEVRPPTAVSSVLGPILAEATLQVIRNQADPAQAAQAAAERLNTP